MKCSFAFLAFMTATLPAWADSLVSTDQAIFSHYGHNSASIQQFGSNNEADIIQDYGGNVASVKQTGSANSATVNQLGGESANITQANGMAVTVTQSGTAGHVTITQSNPRR